MILPNYRLTFRNNNIVLRSISLYYTIKTNVIYFYLIVNAATHVNPVKTRVTNLKHV